MRAQNCMNVRHWQSTVGNWDGSIKSYRSVQHEPKFRPLKYDDTILQNKYAWLCILIPVCFFNQNKLITFFNSINYHKIRKKINKCILNFTLCMASNASFSAFFRLIDSSNAFCLELSTSTMVFSSSSKSLSKEISSCYVS